MNERRVSEWQTSFTVLLELWGSVAAAGLTVPLFWLMSVVVVAVVVVVGERRGLTEKRFGMWW